MLHIPVILGHRPRPVYRGNKMWSNGPYDQVPPQNAHSAESGLMITRDGLSASQNAHSDESGLMITRDGLSASQNAHNDESDLRITRDDLSASQSAHSAESDLKITGDDLSASQSAHSDGSDLKITKDGLSASQNAHSEESDLKITRDDLSASQNAHNDESDLRITRDDLSASQNAHSAESDLRITRDDLSASQSAHSDGSDLKITKDGLSASLNAHSEESDLKITKDGLSASRQREYRDMKNDLRRKSSSSSHYSRQRSPHNGAPRVFKKSSIGQKNSPHSGSGFSGGHSPKRSRRRSSPLSELRQSRQAHAPYRRHREEKLEGDQKRLGQSLKTLRDTHPSSSSTVPSSEVLSKLSKFNEKGLPEVPSRQAVEKPKVADESGLPKISEFKVGLTEPLLQPQQPEPNRTQDTELVDDQLTNRLKAIASKTKEIEQAYHQDCETFGMVVKMLVDKDPSLEKSIQFALRQSLHEISERCVKELRQFIAEYDAS
ncbi:periphilin-1-like [Mesocricetus auratus]|uniref:Periphilin-1-like n=1 Tax=Mesocricetus auratus TaxID=10036 RepID=A0ABM2W6W4_MESAU|nr:periphilin-1-like [Mesocricetus auratus]